MQQGTTEITHSYWLNLTYRVNDNTGSCKAEVEAIRPGEWITVLLPKKDVVPERGKIRVLQGSVVFEGGLREVNVDGKDYKLIDVCPPLSPEESRKAYEIPLKLEEI